jgi:hypothetical protein
MTGATYEHLRHWLSQTREPLIVCTSGKSERISGNRTERGIGRPGE